MSATSVSTDRRAERLLLERYHLNDDINARQELIARAMPLVRHVARRYANRGEPLDDLVQVGAVGLMKAIDRYDVKAGTTLASFATPCIAGEIKRHFRDRGWSVRVPRDIQERAAKLPELTDRLTARLGRSPSVGELAEAMKCEEEDVLEAMEGANAYNSVSFEVPAGEDGRTLQDALGIEEDGFELAEDRSLVSDGLRALDERERTIVTLRFYAGLTQREIAERVGVSQMHVSRLLRRALEDLHERLEEPAAAQPSEQRPQLRRVA